MDTTPLTTSSSLALSLPPELLAEIFLHLYKDKSVPRAKHDIRNTHKLTFIMLVCKRWKDIVERAPILWTDIWLGRRPSYMGNEDTGRWLDYTKTRFVRSGSLPLNLTIMVAHVNLGEVGQVLLRHIGRCKMLTLRALQNETMLIPNAQSDTSSAIYRILSSPLPMLQTITIDEFAFEQILEYDRRALELDAPNLRDINTLSPDIIPFVKPDLPLLSAHNSLERLSISPGWGNILPHLPRNRISLPNLKFLSVAYLDHLWDLLRVVETPNLEHFAIMCGVAEWPEEVNTVIPVMSNLRELEWYTDPDALCEQPTLRHLLQHCPNITSLSYICDGHSTASLEEDLVAGGGDGPALASSILLYETQGGSLQFCPELRRLRLACASFRQIRDLVLLRPMLEHVSMQYRILGEEIVTSSEDDWREKVKLVRWIRSKIQFEFPIDVVAVGSDFQEEEGVFWDPSGSPAR